MHSPWEGEKYEGLLVEANPSGSLSLAGFLSKWSYMAAVQPRQALAYLLYLGYQGDPAALFCFSRQRRQERRADAPSRSFYRVGAAIFIPPCRQ